MESFVQNNANSLEKYKELNTLYKQMIENLRIKAIDNKWSIDTTRLTYICSSDSSKIFAKIINLIRESIMGFKCVTNDSA